MILDTDELANQKVMNKEIMKLVRTFHPVGHGAFYTERFYRGTIDDYNVANIVYDCGSGSAHDILLKMIDKEFKNTDIIDAVYVSHLHDDHINGLVALSERCNVQKVIIPCLPNDHKVWIMIYNALEYGANSVANQILGGKIYENESLQNVEIIAVEDENIYPISHPLFKSPLWKYKAYCLPNYSKTFLTRYSQLIAILQKDITFCKAFVNGDVDCRLLYDILSKGENINTLKNIINSNKLRLDNNSFNLVVGSQRAYCYAPYLPSYLGCLYTGDAELKSHKRMKELQSKYNLNMWNYHIVQVPHHGAKGNNHNIKLYDQYQICVISANSNDKKHPNDKVIEEIVEKNCIPKIITEDKRTIFQLTYSPL